MLLFLLLAVDLSTGSVGASFEYETPDIEVYINYFGISTMAGMGKVKTTNFMGCVLGGGVGGVSGGAFSAVGACLALSLLELALSLLNLRQPRAVFSVSLPIRLFYACTELL